MEKAMNVESDSCVTNSKNLFDKDTCFETKFKFSEDIANNQEDAMAGSMPVNFSPAKYAFFYNDSNNGNNQGPNLTDSFERLKTDKATFFRTDVLLSPKYRGKVNLFDSSFEDFGTQLTKIDSIPIKSDESLDDITEKSDSNDVGSHNTSSTVSAEGGLISNTSDHSIFTLVSPSKFMSRSQVNRLSVSSDSKVELGKLIKVEKKNGEEDEEEDDDERTPTSLSFHDVSEEFLESSGKDLRYSTLMGVADGKYSTIATFSWDKKSSNDDVEEGSCLRKIQKLRNINSRTGNLTNRFSRSQETYRLQSDPDDTSDLDSSRNEDYDDDSVAISLDPMDGNYDSVSLVSDGAEGCATYIDVEAAEESPSCESEPIGCEDSNEDDVIACDLVSFVRNFDRQAGRDVRHQEGKSVKMADEKIPNDEDFILGNSLQTMKKHFKKNFQLPIDERTSPAKHQNNQKSDRSPQPPGKPGGAGTTDSSPPSPPRKFPSATSKTQPCPLPCFRARLELDAQKSTEPFSSHDLHKPNARSPAVSCKIDPASHKPCLTPDEEFLGDASKRDVATSDRLGGEVSELESVEESEGLTASQRMLLEDFKFVAQRGSREKERPSAARLAKRLYHLQGFKKSDVSRHLSKRNSFALLVGEEYLKHFDFASERLDDSLRAFLQNMAFIHEIPCDKERIVQHFARRYFECNPGRFENEGVVHSLAYALLILDNDLNSQPMLQKVSSQEFVENFMESQMNVGNEVPDSLTRDFLHQLYHSIRVEPLELQIELALVVVQQPQQRGLILPTPQTPMSPYNTVVADNSSPLIGRNGLQTKASLEKGFSSDCNDQLELKKGYVMRKCCLDANGRKTGLGRRGWKMFYGVLRDTNLFLYTSERASKSKKSRKARSTLVLSKSSSQVSSDGVVSTPKKSLGNSLKSRVLGRLSRNSKSKTGSLDSGIMNSAAADDDDDDEESRNSPSVVTCSDVEDEGTPTEFENETHFKFESLGSRSLGDTLPREPKSPGKGLRPPPVANGSNTISLLHSLSTKATDYIKKSHVFRLHTADQAQYLIQTSDMKECQDWMDCINMVSALNSSPLQGFEPQEWFDRPIANLECSTLSIKEQAAEHEKMVARYEKMLLEYRRTAPEKGSRSRVIREYCHKENFLKFEIKRFKVYAKLLQYQLNVCPQLEPSLAETTIGEVEEPSYSPVETPPSTFFKESPGFPTNPSELRSSKTQEAPPNRLAVDIKADDSHTHPPCSSSSSSTSSTSFPARMHDLTPAFSCNTNPSKERNASSAEKEEALFSEVTPAVSAAVGPDCCTGVIVCDPLARATLTPT